MTDPLRDTLSRIDHVAPTDAVYRRALEGPRRPEPPGPGRRTRVLAGLTAFAVFAVAAGFAWRIVRNTETLQRTGPHPTASTSVAPALGSPGTVLWPEQDANEIADAQARADSGSGGDPWRLDAERLTARFAETVLGWPDSDYQVTFESVGTGAQIAHLERPPAECPSPQPGSDRIDAACLGGAEDLTLVQPATLGDGGIWSVSAVTSPTTSIEAVPGQPVTNGTTVTAHLDDQDGLYASAGASIGSFTEHGSEKNCSAVDETTPHDGAVQIELSVQADAEAGTDCGQDTTAYVWVATAGWGAPNGRTGNPLVGDSSPYVALAAVPVVLSIPENAPSAGLSTYTDPMGWKADYPTGWIVTPFEDSSSGRLTLAGAAISNLPMLQEQPGGYPGVPSDGSFEGGVGVVITHRDGGPAPDVLRDDPSFPLDPAAAQMLPGGMALAAVLPFRGNGMEYQATFSGQHPSNDDLRALLEVIRSIRFPALATGQTSGGWLSLGPSDDFKDETGTPWWAGGRLGVVYVMRGPGGTYALDLDPDSCGEGQSQQWDPHRLQVLIECPGGTEIRYERDGTPLPGNPSGSSEPLEIHPVITAWDGSLLINVNSRVDGIVDTYWP
jgi:hypothetical protein